MQFGIMAMQLGALMPPEGSPEAIMARVMGLQHADLVGEIVAQGFNPIEIGGDLVLFFPQMFSPEQIAPLVELKAREGLRYTVHLPLWSVEPSTPLTPVREGSAQAIIDCIRAVQPLDPEAYVLHATGALAAEFYRMRLPEMARSLILEQFKGGARQSIKTILAETGLSSRKLAIETIEFPFDLTLKLAEELDTSICFDTGHVLVGFSGEGDFWETLDRALPRLGEVHLHDAPRYAPDQPLGYGKDHQTLGMADLDVGRFLDRLHEAGWDGPIIFELTVQEALASLETIRALRPAYLEN